MRVAMELLSSREDPASTATLLAAARAGPPALRAAALGHVARRDEPEVAPIVLAAFAQHEPEEVREAALLALPWSATPEVLLSAAAEALEAPSPRLRSAAVRALTRRLSPPAPFREQRAGLLLSLFGRPDVPAADLVRVLSCVDPGEDRLRDLFLSASAPAVRGEALRHLASRYPASIDFDQILSAAEDPANPIRSAAYAALGHVWPGPTARRLLGPDAVFPPDQECLPALDAILASGREHECPVVLLVSGLLRIGANAPSPLFRRRALELLAQLGPLDPAGVAAAAIHILASPESSPLVRSAAIAVFLSVPVLDQAARGALGRALSDPDDIVADRAAEVLLRRPTSPIDRSLPQAVARARHAPDPALRADAVLRSVLLADSASLLREATRDPHPVVRFAALASDDTSLPGTLLTALEVCLREVPALGAPPAAANWLDGASSVSPLPAPGALAEEFVERLYALRAGPEQDFRHEESARLRENRERAVAGALRILDDPREGNGADALRDLSWAGGRSVLDYVQAACAAPDEATRAEALKALRRILGGRLTPVFAHTAFEELQDWWTDRAFSAPVPLFDLPSKHDR
ncbi:MAG: hypothetical protein MUE73_01510 [Planctomycetes bacterium]|jgi:hypothetical protein|nr:hypothetical protein [Planctomycetota bacterium]